MRTWVPLAVASLVYVLALMWSAGQLPADGVPLHFGVGGVADRFGGRTEAVAGLSVIGVLLLVTAIGVQALVRFTPLNSINVPHKEYWATPERESRMRRMLAEDCSYLLAVVLALMAFVPLSTVYAVRQDPPSIPAAAFWGGLVLMMVIVGARVLHMQRSRYAPPEGADRD